LADDAPAFAYDRGKTPKYLGQTVQTAETGTAVELRKELAAAVDEILDGPWLPLYSDYSAAQAGGVAPAEWCFNRPGEYLRVLAQSAPYLSAAQRKKTQEFLNAMIRDCSPTRQVYWTTKEGKARNVRRTPAVQYPWLADADKQRLLFDEAYSVWACASAFGSWDDVRPLYEDLKKLRAQLESRGDFEPAYKPDCAGPLTTADAKNPEYRFRVYQALLAGYQDNYCYHGAAEARARMQKGKPVFFYVRTLSSLLGYYRLARRLGQDDEAAWARQTFEKVAAVTLGQKSAPFLWSDPHLCPEIGRLVRDAAGNWLEELARTPNVGNLPATDWGQKPVPGKRDYYVMNPHTWYHAWGGQGEGIRPRTVLGAFLAHAWLLGAPPEKVAATLDIPWCKADLYYAAKLVVAIQASEKAGWMEVNR
jgi:hypothetical protein